MPSISPGEEAERAAALKSAWGDFGATERRLEGLEQAGDHTGAAGLITGDFNAAAVHFRATIEADRKSVVSGKSVSVRVELGGRRNIKKKKSEDTTCVARLTPLHIYTVIHDAKRVSISSAIYNS